MDDVQRDRMGNEREEIEKVKHCGKVKPGRTSIIFPMHNCCMTLL